MSLQSSPETPQRCTVTSLYRVEVESQTDPSHCEIRSENEETLGQRSRYLSPPYNI